MENVPKGTTSGVLSSKLGLTPTVSKPSHAIHMRRGTSLPMPGAHAALLRRLFGKKDRRAAV